MSILSVTEFKIILQKRFNQQATCWSQATDEIRDLCRYARGYLGLDEDQAVDFRVLKTPMDWNVQGVNGLLKFYEQMSESQRENFIDAEQHLWDRRTKNS